MNQEQENIKSNYASILIIKNIMVKIKNIDKTNSKVEQLRNRLVNLDQLPKRSRKKR